MGLIIGYYPLRATVKKEALGRGPGLFILYIPPRGVTMEGEHYGFRKNEDLHSGTEETG